MKRKRVDEVLSKHPLMQRLMKDTKPIVLRCSEVYNEYVKRTGKIRMAKPTKPLTPNERYRVDVFQRAVSILNATERLEICRTFVRRFPSPRTYQKSGIGHHTWLEYHFGYYIILLVSLADVALILTNEVFGLGNQERNCKSYIIKSNDYIRGTKVKTALDALEVLVKPYRRVRNMHVHRGKSPDIPDILNSEQLDQFMLTSKVAVMSKPAKTPEILDLMFSGQAREIVQRMTGELDELQKVLSRLFDSILPTYETHVVLRGPP